MPNKREQVALQCDAVVHMAYLIGGLYSDFAIMFRSGAAENLLDQVGARTASFMEKLGDMLNATGSCTEEDEWMDPVFEEAHRLWPQQSGEVKK
jgi:hypothetical protein